MEDANEITLSVKNQDMYFVLYDCITCKEKDCKEWYTNEISCLIWIVFSLFRKLSVIYHFHNFKVKSEIKKPEKKKENISFENDAQ